MTKLMHKNEQAKQASSKVHPWKNINPNNEMVCAGMAI